MNENIDYTKEYDNSARVANSTELLDRLITDAANFRDDPDLIAEYDLSYGPALRNRMDVFWPSNGAGRKKQSRIVMFIHGGYWQRMDRSAFSHLARGLLDNGLAVAMPSYTLCPDIKIDGIINEIRRACLLLYQTYKRRFTVIGHSAGGHLAACMVATDWDTIHHDLPNDLVASGLGISGIFDLLPLLQTPINDALQMDEVQAIAASPIRWIPETQQRFDAWVGSTESGEFHRQSQSLAERWSLLGSPTQYQSVPGKNHFTVIDDLKHRNSRLVNRIVDLTEQPLAEENIPEPDEDEIQKLILQSSNESADTGADTGDEASAPTVESQTHEPQTNNEQDQQQADNLQELQ